MIAEELAHADFENYWPLCDELLKAHMTAMTKIHRQFTKVEQPTEKETVRCYFCGNSIGPHVKIRRFHELTVHESCYQRDVAP